MNSDWFKMGQAFKSLGYAIYLTELERRAKSVKNGTVETVFLGRM